MSDIKTIVGVVTEDVLSYPDHDVVFVKTVSDFFQVEALLKEKGYTNVFKRQIEQITHINDITSQEDLDKLLEFIDEATVDIQGVIDDYQTPLVSFLLSYPVVVTKNYFGVQELFLHESHRVYIIKLYTLRAQIEDEYTSISSYGFEKVYQYIQGKPLRFEHGLDEDSFNAFFEAEQIASLMKQITGYELTPEELQKLSDQYIQEESSHKGEELLGDKKTRAALNQLFFAKLEQAKKEKTALFSLDPLSEEEVLNRLQLIAKYLSMYVSQLKGLDVPMKGILAQNDIDVPMNRALMLIKSYSQGNEMLDEEILKTLHTIDVKKEQTKDHVMFFQEAIGEYEHILSVIQL